MRLCARVQACVCRRRPAAADHGTIMAERGTIMAERGTIMADRGTIMADLLRPTTALLWPTAALLWPTCCGKSLRPPCCFCMTSSSVTSSRTCARARVRARRRARVWGGWAPWRCRRLAGRRRSDPSTRRLRRHCRMEHSIENSIEHSRTGFGPVHQLAELTVRQHMRAVVVVDEPVDLYPVRVRAPVRARVLERASGPQRGL